MTKKYIEEKLLFVDDLSWTLLVYTIHQCFSARSVFDMLIVIHPETCYICKLEVEKFSNNIDFLPVLHDLSVGLGRDTFVGEYE